MWELLAAVLLGVLLAVFVLARPALKHFFSPAQRSMRSRMRQQRREARRSLSLMNEARVNGHPRRAESW
jgi:hypothetical protein